MGSVAGHPRKCSAAIEDEMTYLLPNGQNAISEFSATIQFAGPLDPSLHDTVRTAVKEVGAKLGLPAPVQMQFINLNLSGAPIQGRPFFAGAQKFAPNGQIDESFSCDEANFTFTTARYDGWVSVKERLLTAMEPIFRIYASGLPLVSNFRLQYINEFRCAVDADTSPFTVLRDENRWIPGYVLGATDAWHVHTGKFTLFGDAERELVNVNFDFAPQFFVNEQIFKRLGVLIVSGVFYNIPGQQPLVLDPQNLEGVIENYFERTHTREKEMVSEIFADDYLRMMGALQ